MKELRVTFEDKEYKKLIKIKKDMTWRRFIILGGTKIENEYVEAKK